MFRLKGKKFFVLILVVFLLAVVLCSNSVLLPPVSAGSSPAPDTYGYLTRQFPNFADLFYGQDVGVQYEQAWLMVQDGHIGWYYTPDVVCYVNFGGKIINCYRLD